MNTVTMLERAADARKPKGFIEREFPSGSGAKFVTITPDVARELLALNHENRHLSPTKISHYAGDIIAGRWAVNGEPIIISDDGQLNDGQHRLLGCIEAEAPFDTLIVFGVKRETRTTVDQGRARTLGDYMQMSGITNAKLVATTARRACAFARSGKRSVESKWITNGEADEFFKANEHRLAVSASYATSAPKNFASLAGRSMVAFWHFILSQCGDTGMDYLDQIIHGENLRQLDPAYAVRNRLMAMGRATFQAKTEAVLRGWVYFRDGKPLHKVQLMGEFPTL
jgi:hypothetical protein